MLPRAFAAFILLCLILFPRISQAQDIVLIGPDTYPANINPLTGLTVEDPAVLNRRPIMVKISNFPPEVRPQSGLNSADLVWESLLAGGVTRFNAFYLSQDVAPVGPIRSARLVDFQLLRAYRSLWVYSGMAQGTLDRLNADALAQSRAVGGAGPCPALCRIPREGMALEHTLFGDVAALREMAVINERDVTPEPLSGMAFSTSIPTDGLALNSVQVQYRETTIEWQYDAEQGRWLRFQDGEAQFDALDDQPVSTANVIIMEAEHIEQPIVTEGYWGPANYAVDVPLLRSGRMVLLRDGQMFEGQWTREISSTPINLLDLEGQPIALKPGNTFVNLVPRWIDGFQLAFLLTDAPSATVLGEDGINLRTGPGEAYRTPDVAYPGDSYRAIGRNRSADWIQIETGSGSIYWLPLDQVEFSGSDPMSLPISRPESER
jgi:hypothetical protein